MNLLWLQRWCKEVAGEAGCGDLALAVCRVLLTAPAGEAAAAELYELLGDGALDRIGALVEQRYPAPGRLPCLRADTARAANSITQPPTHMAGRLLV